ncbi:spondin domain-containing protein [uncultured Algibacter sp.]|uniref:spondin domain-containing protein n=1 Tax=uncultured Algibacter sp. TaxID=298659 RepID=UPI002637E1E1|nr:spondin domain-containing protein [uncultured Algibacter sp.]
MKNIILSLLLFGTLLSCSNSDDNAKTIITVKTIATYNITFTNFWNEADHGPLPSSPHWSPLVGVNHSSEITFLETGSIASQGIEDIAENGVNTNFNNDVIESIANGTSEQYIEGSSLFLSNGNTIEINDLKISQDYPLLTLISMIAPSPDWMVFINGVNLRNENNEEWKTLVNLDLSVYDSGTDSGSSYSAANSDIKPHLPISSLQGIVPFNNEKVASLAITLQSIATLDN